MLIRLYWRLRIFFLALRWIPQINLGDMVWYKGNKYRVLNGVRCKSWRLSGLDNEDDGWVPRCECKKVLSPTNMIDSFRSGWNFYMTSWYEIWCRSGILPWMKRCKIWPWPFNR
jgi:hypothetical protein